MTTNPVSWCVLLCFVLGVANQSSSADKAEIQRAISRGANLLKTQLPMKSGGSKSLAYLTLFKAGEPPESPLMIAAVEGILAKFKDETYRASSHIYEAAIDATLLADLDGEKYLPQIQLIANYIIENQDEGGFWKYPPPAETSSLIEGDVSVSHYACLGLWAAARAGVVIDPQVWVRVLAWTSRSQNSDGGYAYCPRVVNGPEGDKSSINMTVNSVGTICIAMLNLDPKRLPSLESGKPSSPPPSKSKAKVTEPASEPKPTGALEAVDLDAKVEAEKSKAFAPGRIPNSSFNTMGSAYRWFSTRYEPINTTTPHKAYYYYSLERMAALANVTKINDRDWYNECAEALLASQKPDGSWEMTEHGGPQNDTCFCVLFLTRSTGKILKRTQITNEPPVGGGLLSGGRGLPDDLKEVDQNGNVRKKKEASSLNDLLASLQNPEALNLEETQAELVQQIQLGDKQQLIGQKDKLLMLVEQPDPEIRRTAIWAIGRTGDLSLARFAILGLDDPSAGVMTESHMALCWTARKPNAFKLPLDPLDGIAADAGPDQKSAAIESWRRQALRLWGEWYLRNRPYADRGDEFETNLRNRLLQLK